MEIVMKLVLLVCSLLFVAGCEQPRPFVWDCPSKDKLAFDQDWAGCMMHQNQIASQDAALNSSGIYPYPNDPILNLQRQNQQMFNQQLQFDLCMQSKGWHKVFLDGK